MALTEAKKKANDKYIKNNYKQIKIAVPKAEAEELDNFVAEMKEKDSKFSKAGFIREAIKEKMRKTLAEENL